MHGAHITVRYWCSDLYNDYDVENSGMSPIELIKSLIESEGITGLCNDNGEVVKIDICEEPK